MASLQVCPVCKTFSSSWNTTLNAHIDQCLSVGPSTKCQASSKSVKHQTKARRMRLMVDIYKTSSRSTLLDLDQRNGTNWASNLRLIAEDNDKVHSSVDDKDATSDRSGVYIVSNGMKLRVLSQLSNGPSSTTSNHSSDESNLLLRKKGKHLDEQQSGSEEQEDLVHDESDDLVFIAKRVGSKRTVRRKVSIGDHETTGFMESMEEQSISRSFFSSMGTEMVHNDVLCDKDVSVVNPKVSQLRKKRLVRLNSENSIVAVKGANTQYAANDDIIYSPGEAERSYQFASEYIISKVSADEAFAFSRKTLNTSCNVEEYKGLNPETDGSYLEGDHKNSYTDMTSIIIPGPPGCDLPSPGLEGSDELHPNSSFNIYRIQSSNDEHIDSSDSAKSAVLSPSNTPAVDGNNLKNISMMLSHIQPTNRVVYSETRINPPLEPVAGAEQERSPHELSNLQYFHASQWYQTPQLQDFSSVSGSPYEQQLFPASCGYKSPNRKSTPNLILRLMGKNLMVVNKDDEPSPNTKFTTDCISDRRNRPGSTFSPASRWSSIDDKVDTDLPNQI